MQVARGLYGLQPMGMPSLQLRGESCRSPRDVCSSRLGKSPAKRPGSSSCREELHLLYTSRRTCLFTNDGFGIKTLLINFFNLTLGGETKSCFTLEGVLNVHNSALWAQVDPYAVREQCVRSASVTAFGLGPCLTRAGWLLYVIAIFFKLF